MAEFVLLCRADSLSKDLITPNEDCDIQNPTPAIFNKFVFIAEHKMRIVRFTTQVLVVGLLCVPVLGQGKKGGGGGGNSASSSSTAQTSTQSQSAGSTATIESQMLAYGGLDLVSPAIATAACSHLDNNGTVIIFDQTAFTSVQAYEAFLASAKVLLGNYEALAPNPRTFLQDLDARIKARKDAAKPSSAMKTFDLGLSGTVDPFSDATSLLQAIAIASNTESGGAIVMPDSAVAVTLSRDLQSAPGCYGKNLTIIYPPLFGKSSNTDYASANVNALLQEVEDARSVIQEEIAKHNNPNATDPQSSTRYDPTIATMLGDVNGIYDNFLNTLLQVNSTTGNVGMAAVVQGYELAKLMAGTKNSDDPMNPSTDPGWKVEPANILLASVLGAGGTERTHKSLWTALGSGDKITYSGGLIVNMSLWQADAAAPKYSKIFRYRAPFSDVQNPKVNTNVTDGDNIH